MKRLLPLILILTALSSCSDDDTESVPARLRRVVVAYIIGENSLYADAVDDLNEMRAGAGLIPDNCKFVVFYDNSSSTAMPQIISFDSETGEQLLYEYGEDVVSTDSAAMQNALQYIIDTNDADEYALILWSHGSGWLESSKKRTIGIDNGNNTSSNSGTEMEIPTLRRVLENTGVQWQFVFYDACFMQCVEVAYELRNVAAWSIGSPAEIPGGGANYTALMPCFFESDGFARDITEQYFNIYQSNYGLIISAIQSNQLENLAQSTADAVASLDEFPADGIQQYCAYASSTSYKPEYYDMGSCIYHWTGDSGYALWENAMDRAIPYRYYTNSWLTSFSSAFSARMTDAEHFAGVSMYFAVEGRDNDNEAWRGYQWYDAVGYLMDLPGASK